MQDQLLTNYARNTVGLLVLSCCYLAVSGSSSCPCWKLCSKWQPGCLKNALWAICYCPNILSTRVPLLFSWSFIPWLVYRLHSAPRLCFVRLKKQSQFCLIRQMANGSAFSRLCWSSIMSRIIFQSLTFLK